MTRLLTLEEVEAKSAINRAAHQPRRVNLLDVGAQLKKPGRPKAQYRAPAPTEHQEQCAVITWFDSFAPTRGLDPRLLFAIPNGSNKSPASAMKFKREGLRSGVMDLMLATSIHTLNGLFVEMKRVRGSTTSPEQLQMAELFREQGYRVVLCKGADEAIAAIKNYLGV